MVKKFSEIINENQTVILDDNRGGNAFQTNKYGGRKSIAYLNAVIKSFIERVYGRFGFRYPVRGDNNFTHFDMNINGKIINTEYIAKMVNNYTIFKTVIRTFNLKDEDSFYHFMMNNLNNIYHYDGDFFKRESLPILINTTRNGNRYETRAKEIFQNYANSQNIQISIQDPTLDEDINGVDFKFLHNGRQFTVQVKPYDQYEVVDGVVSDVVSKLPTGQFSKIINVSSPGSLSLDVDYLILYNVSNYIILRNPSSNKIEIRGKKYVTDSSNIIKII